MNEQSRFLSVDLGSRFLSVDLGSSIAETLSSFAVQSDDGGRHVQQPY